MKISDLKENDLIYWSNLDDDDNVYFYLITKIDATTSDPGWVFMNFQTFEDNKFCEYNVLSYKLDFELNCKYLTAKLIESNSNANRLKETTISALIFK